MEDPEVYLRAIAASRAGARKGSPAARLSLEAVANAFVVLGLLPAVRAEEILSAQQPVLEAAGVRVGREIGELSVSPGARSFQQTRAAALDQPRQIPLAVAAGPVRCRLRRHDVAITWATLTPEGIRLRYHGEAVDGDTNLARVLAGEITEDITELSITDDEGGTYRMPAASVPGGISGQCSASGQTRWIPEGEFLAVPVRGGGSAVRWLELSAGSGLPVRVEIPSPAVVPTGTSEPPWPTPAECYLDRLAPPDHDWSVGSFETGTVELDTAAIMAAVAAALLAVGALPPDSVVLPGITDRVRPDWPLALSDHQRALMEPWASRGQASGTDLAIRLPLKRATAVLEGITAREDMVSVRLYGHPWIFPEDWPLIVPCFQVIAIDDTGAAHEGGSDSSTGSPAHEGRSAFWFWPPVDPQARQLRVIVSTLWEAAWALVDIPGR
ncbi:MAG: hypothetical protein M3Z75_09680 [Actinomycetota bacterium]|nr:hypothetical protein [Actinomycetota bacterium]